MCVCVRVHERERESDVLMVWVVTGGGTCLWWHNPNSRGQRSKRWGRPVALDVGGFLRVPVIVVRSITFGALDVAARVVARPQRAQVTDGSKVK